jgi:hypothetical protein
MLPLVVANFNFPAPAREKQENTPENTENLLPLPPPSLKQAHAVLHCMKR